MARTDETNLESAQPGPAIPQHKEGCSISDYRKIVRLGEGTFGEVWKAERGGFPVALKILKGSLSSDEAQREIKSLESLRKLHHKYLLHTENFWSDGDRLFIEMELAEGGTLKERLKAYQGMGRDGIPEDELLKYFTEAAQALDYLHSHRPVFLHRDIKPANILLVQGAAKLADFGLLRQVTGDNTSTKTQGGTPVYMAPESIKEDRFSVHTDLFSFAVTYAELRQGKLPFFAKTQFQIYQRICQDPPDLTDIFHPEERKVLLKALAKDPDQRYSSCGEFVFELNRVVPWVPAVNVPILSAPADSPAVEATDVGSAKPVRKRSPVTMEDMELPGASVPSPNAPTAQRDEGTVLNESARRPGKPAPEPATMPQAYPTDKKDPAASAPSTSSKFKTTGKNPTAGFAQAHSKARSRVLGRVLLTAVVFAMIGAVWFGVTQMRKDSVDPNADKKDPRADGSAKTLSPEAIAERVQKALDSDDVADARATLAKNKISLPDGGTALNAQIQKRADVLAILSTAEEMLKKKEFDTCLAYLATAQAPMENSRDKSRRTKIFESARDSVHQRLVTSLTDKVKAKDAAGARSALVGLTKFRKEHPALAAKSDFQELPFPTELVRQAWQSLHDEKSKSADSRARLEAIKEYTIGSLPEKFILDPLLDKNLLALEPIVQAHELAGSDWAKVIPDVIGVLTDKDHPPDLARNAWLAAVQLEKKRKLFRFEDLDSLAAVSIDDQARTASEQTFALALERLIQADNYKWYPSEPQCSKFLTWCDQRLGTLSARVRAMKAECLVRTGAKADAFKSIGFPLQTDWYGSYVEALSAAHQSTDAKQIEAAADLITGALKVKPRVIPNPRERARKSGDILRSAVRKLAPAGAEPRTFASSKDAARVLGWLTLVLDLDESQGEASLLVDLIDLASAAVGADAVDAGDHLKRAALRLDKLGEADKSTGFESLAKIHRLEVDQAAARLVKADPQGDVWQQAVTKSKRSQDFAYLARSRTSLKTAAELNGRAVEVEALAVFEKPKAAAKTKAKYRVFEAALKRAKDEGAKKQASAFLFPVLIPALESAGDFAREEIEAIGADAEAAFDATLPQQPGWQELRNKTMVRLADAHIYLVFKRLDAKDKVDLKVEYSKMLSLYSQARPKYTERYSGELAYKIGSMHFRLNDFKNAKKELLDARDRIASISQPYSAVAAPFIRTAVDDVNELLKSDELKNLNGDK